MASEHHATSSLKDDIVRISGYIIKELEKGRVGVFCCGRLLLANIVDTNKDFVINSLRIIKEIAKNGLDEGDACVV